MEKNRNVSVSQIMAEIRDSLSLPDKAYFFDTTLRDGEQTPGISFTRKEKISIAQTLNDMKIDVIEAGFPVTSTGDFEACKSISKLGLDSEVMGLARMAKLDIDRVIEADMDSLHVFIATSDLHMKAKLKMTRDQVIDVIEISSNGSPSIFCINRLSDGISSTQGAHQVAQKLTMVIFFV